MKSYEELQEDEKIKAIERKYDTDIALLKEAILDMQQLLKNPEKLAVKNIYYIILSINSI